MLDDIEFAKSVDPTVEFDGLFASCKGVEEKQVARPNIDKEVQFSDEGTPYGSDEEGVVEKLPQFRASTDMEYPEFSIGLQFASKADFKQAILNYAFKAGKDLKFCKNDNVRCVVNCKQNGCPWTITLRLDPHSNTWRITTFNNSHVECPWVKQNKMVKATTLAKRWKNEIKGHSTWTTKEFRAKVASDEHFTVTKRQGIKAMKLARDAIKGDLEDYFNKFWGYYLEIQRTNPNTTSIVKSSNLVEDEGKERFIRSYICWDACKQGFKHCRKIIGVDGCHLKSKYGGQLLTATTLDPNDGIFPIAYAIVEGENKDSWIWFLRLLKNDLEITKVGEHYLTFVSDKQKGLVPAFHEVFPNSSHRFCVRHLCANMNAAGFNGKAIKDTMWTAARATTINQYTTAMRNLERMDIAAFEWLTDKHPEWSRSHFNEHALCDMLVNNVSECFNAMILDARENPLLNCLESLRELLMTRLFEKREEALKWKGPICPNIFRKLVEIEKGVGGYMPIQCDLMLLEVKGMYTDEHEKVNLERRMCSCRKWDLTGIPCKHAIAAIWMKKQSPIDYVNVCYKKETYLAVYGRCIHPMAGPNGWPETQLVAPLPPIYTARAGRPKKLRKKGADEIKQKPKGANQLTTDGVHLSRTHVTLHCTKCKQKGHNSRKCPLNGNRPTPSSQPAMEAPSQPNPETASEIPEYLPENPAHEVVVFYIHLMCLLHVEEGHEVVNNQELPI
ncbi:PREDICTED: uncharacterized protein LOC109156168 [Ipomoea nil]|uniref:uncharacterized protein LOC109156168 n=1 Tax=Ipomoea nil TaxID=35883 RepID=UPI0009008DB6|nr:PREDICTED: uncharacterized protein LOC109156168 [Ipomoea nil]